MLYASSWVDNATNCDISRQVTFNSSIAETNLAKSVYAKQIDPLWIGVLDRSAHQTRALHGHSDLCSRVCRAAGVGAFFFFSGTFAPLRDMLNQLVLAVLP